MGIDVREHRLKAQIKRVDPALLPKQRMKAQWVKLPAREGGGRLGVVRGDWWFGQVRVLPGNGKKVWTARLSLDDRQSTVVEGSTQTFAQAEKAALRALNDVLLNWAEVRTRVEKCRRGPWEYDGSEVWGRVREPKKLTFGQRVRLLLQHLVLVFRAPKMLPTSR